jgi:hypothetical protein
MSLELIRNEIGQIIETVTGIGIVHSYLRWSNTFDGFLNLFKDSTDKINGCMITRVKTPEEFVGGGRTSERSHMMKIVCIYGLKDGDASELYFQDTIIEGICVALRHEKTLNNRRANLGLPQVDIVEPRKFGSVLCHYAEITVSVTEMVER